MHYFFSDVHLGLGTPESNREREGALLRFLDMVKRERAESLYIVGDLFDYWFEYRSVVPRGFSRTIGALASVVDAGVHVEYLMGNHDFGHRDFFEKEIGIRVHSGDIERTIAGRRCYLSHGDGKAFNDTGYLILKKVLRARISGALFRFIHPDIGIGVAAGASRRSRDHTNKKNYDGEKPGESDGLYAFAEKKITREGFQLVVMGHSHRPRRADLAEGTYINLGAWLRDRFYLAMDEEGMEMIRFEG
ncbi:MAG: UDP-2,3-diacylglucosamine diphosphatase [Bacteroidota bacterium]